ncbi:MAG: ABC transporter ATP-binding protein [Eubacteriales bacterium]
MKNILELKNINKSYGKEVKTQVLSDINLSFREGSFNSIIGQSGSGKSTLLNIIGTLDKPSEGTVLIDGNDTGRMKSDRLSALRNSTIGFVFQFHYLLPEFSAMENVLMPYRIKNGSTSKEIVARADKLMDLVGLEKVKNNLATRMSGGQQQRTAIARALINNPKLILADEPTGNLDSDSTETIYELLRDINDEYGTTIIIITHDRKIAEKADRIIEIKDGRINLDITK